MGRRGDTGATHRVEEEDMKTVCFLGPSRPDLVRCFSHGLTE